MSAITILIVGAPFSRIITKRSFVAVSILWLIEAIVEGKGNFFKVLLGRCPFNKYIAVFILTLIISVLFSCDIYHSQVIFFNRYVYYIVLFYIGCWVGVEGKNVLYLGWVFFFSSIHLSYGGIRDYFYMYHERLIYAYRRIINFTQYIALYFPFDFVVSFFAKNKLIRIIAIIGAAGLYPCLLFNGSRVAWLGVPVALLAAFFMYKKKRLIGITVLLLLLLLAAVIPAQKRDFFTTFQVDTWGDRSQLWATALKIFSHYPISGSGLGMYERLLYQYGPPEGYSEGKIHLHAHNTYLEFLAETGIIGILALFGVLAAFLKLALRYFKQKHEPSIQVVLLGLTAGIIATMVLAMGSSVIIVGFQDAAVFWLIFGVVAGGIASGKIHEKPLTGA